VEIRLAGDECSDYLNFVVKDTSTNTWYDFYGDNFHVPLQLAFSSMAFDESMMASMDGDEGVSIPDDQLPELPGELTGIWAYVKWEHDGCPNRSAEDSDAEFQRGVQVRLPIRCVAANDHFRKLPGRTSAFALEVIYLPSPGGGRIYMGLVW
jgi:hypothetical protein